MHAQTEAVVAGQILRCPRPRPTCKVGRRADNRHARVRPDANRNHILGYLFAEPNAGVVAARHDVGQAVVDVQFHLDVRVVRQQPIQYRPEHRMGRVCAPGSNVTWTPATRAGSGGLNSGSMRTVPVNHSAGPLPEGCEPLRLISIASLPR